MYMCLLIPLTASSGVDQLVRFKLGNICAVG